MAIIEGNRQYLTFALDNEIYGIEVKSIKEILELQSLTKVPGTTDYLLGVMNVRGRVVPVVDLRLKFGFAGKPPTVASAIIVLETLKKRTDKLIGLLVDSVDKVLELSSEDVQPAPAVGTRVDEKLLTGMGKWDERFIMLLDTDAVFPKEDLGISAEAALAG